MASRFNYNSIQFCFLDTAFFDLYTMTKTVVSKYLFVSVMITLMVPIDAQLKIYRSRRDFMYTVNRNACHAHNAMAYGAVCQCATIRDGSPQVIAGLYPANNTAWCYSVKSLGK